ncbi:hypothetical protein GXW82_30790 [Streptacidiphilus sp. 4-A2]|nr:hypothetical protein [Streptacidiphilus sp. 4-A2]
MPDDPDDALPEQTIRGDAVRFAQQGGIVVTGDNARVFQTAGYAAGRDLHIRVDPRQRFLEQVRALALKDASRFSLLSLIFMAGRGNPARRRRPGPDAPRRIHRALHRPDDQPGGVLIGTCGGALALQSKRSQRRLTQEADRVSAELLRDHTREEALALIDRIEDPLLRDRLRSITAMQILGLAPTPEDVANRVFPAPTTPPEIESTPPEP